MQDLFVCIMAGGSGERFWPMSRNQRPKHLLQLLTDRTLLEETVRRMEGVVPLSNVFVLTNEAQLKATRSAVHFLPQENIIAEPAKRDTAPAAALATAIARSRNPNAVCALFPADAMIKNTVSFQRQVRDAVNALSKHKGLLTFAIPPSYAATGFGYLELSDRLGTETEGSQVFLVNRFVEKPNNETAQEYLKSGRFAWNAGMFLWQAETFLEEARRLVPPLAQFIENFPKNNSSSYLAEHFPHLPKISVDYAILEKASRVIAVKAEFDWDDVGTWTALPTHFGQDAMGNTVRGTVTCQDSKNNIAISNGRVIALCGVENLVVVETPDAILVCHQDAVQDIKKLQAQIPEQLR
jgi:mannose-1-phosphate guanylyltransferase